MGGGFVSVSGLSPLPSLEEAHLLPGLISAPLKLPAFPLEVTHQPLNSPKILSLLFMAPSLFVRPSPPPALFRKSTTQGRKKKKEKKRSLSYPQGMGRLVLMYIMLIKIC